MGVDDVVLVSVRSAMVCVHVCVCVCDVVLVSVRSAMLCVSACVCV